MHYRRSHYLAGESEMSFGRSFAVPLPFPRKNVAGSIPNRSLNVDSEAWPSKWFCKRARQTARSHAILSCNFDVLDGT